MKRKLYCLLAAALLLMTAACKKPEGAPAGPTPEPTPETAIVVVDQMPVHVDTWEDILAEEVPPPEEAPPVVSFTTGREIPAGGGFLPTFICYDNAPNRRPLSGIMEADVVYEAPAADGGGTRLMALFCDNRPKQVGPLGATYAGFDSVLKEWDGLIIYEGLPAAKEQVFTPDDLKGSFVDLEELVPALYTALPPVAQVRFLLSEGYVYEGADAALKLRLPFGGGRGEAVEYAYDADARMYLRYQENADGRMTEAKSLSWNEETQALENVPLLVNGVIVQYVEADDGVPVLTGSGKCEYFVGGVRVSGTWARESEAAYTEYFLEDGSVVTMESGHTWIALHPADTPVEVS